MLHTSELHGYEQNEMALLKARRFVAVTRPIRSQVSFTCMNQQEELLLKHAKQKHSAKMTETTFYVLVPIMCQGIISFALHNEV